MADLVVLKKRRSYIKGNMTKMLTFISTVKAETKIEDIKVRIANVEQYRTQFNEIEDKIVELNHEEELDLEFEDNYYKIISGLNRVLREKTEPIMFLNDTINDTSISAVHVDVKLPKLHIPTFTGEYTEWQSFYDLFCSTIHDNTRLTPSQKLQYLKGTLKGEAASLLKHFSITDANYLEALRKLRERYDRRKHGIYAFIKNFISQPSLTIANNVNVRQLLDTSDEILRGLKALGEDAEKRDHWLIYMLVNKFDLETNNLWAQVSAEYDSPTIKQLFDFLLRRVDALDSLKYSTKRYQVPPNPPKAAGIRSHVIASSVEAYRCSLCPKEQHRLFECIKFKELSLDERRSLMKDQRRCFNCLNDNHNVYACKSKFRCRHCNRKHHTLLHENVPYERETTATVINNQTNESNPSSSSHQISVSTANQLGNALLPTALVRILDETNQYQLCRILLDSGSQGSFISERCVQRLQLKRRSAKLAISGIGAVTNGFTRGSTTLIMTPWNKNTPSFQIETLILPKLTSKQPSISECINVSDLKKHELADPYYFSGNEIDVIIGADMFFTIMTDGKITTESQLILQNTLLGWVVSGNASESRPIKVTTINIEKSNIELDKLLRKFWEIESVECDRPQLSKEEDLCVKCFEDTATVDKFGRFQVSLPFKISPSVLGESYPSAIQRMYAMERKFVRSPEFAALYRAFMKEYLSLGHMKEVKDQLPNSNELCYYLPHHGVIKNTSTTTKLRVVFDGSSKTSTGKSLNDCLAVGPITQSSLYEILFRFRTHKVVLTADIEKMYRQVRISEDHTKYHRIVWREHTNKPFRTYELQTVTYGTASASYLATRALIEAANKYQEEYPQAANCIKNAMYVDDLMTGAETVNEAIQLKREINFILAKSGFPLRKWLSNENALNDTTEANNSSKLLEIQESLNNSAKLLGLHWAPTRDCFQFKVSLDDEPTTTKRGVLSEASRLFDPLGWLAPIIITIKIFFQSLWSHNIGWDDELPDILLHEWLQIRNNLLKVEDIELTRYINITSQSKIELHGFSDASKQAYSAVVYGTISNPNEKPIVKLLSAKTKVSPVKQLSIPRLELCAAALLSKLLLIVKEALKSEITAITAWTDSTIVLDWLNSHPSKWNTFVGNRTGDILTHFEPSQWRHVASHENPADCASRGLKPDALKTFDLWWDGPKWLADIANWPKNQRRSTGTSEELRAQTLNVQINQPNIIEKLITNISSFNVMVRILSYVYRYIHIKLKRITRDSLPPHITTLEVQRAQRVILRYIQEKYYHAELKLMKSKKELPASSKIKSFMPFIDEAGLLRIGGRIQNAAISYDIKHPIILTAQEKLTEIIVREHHEKYLHAGPSLMMATLRRKYWILGGRNLIRKVVHNCTRCTRYNARSLNQVMGQLPNPRVELITPFHKVGLDYAGPFQTYITRGRGQKTCKSHICIFVSGYKGRPHRIDQIEFKFIPPSAPHFGGLWEAAVKSVKHHLKRVTNGHILTIEEMSTLLTEIEAILNSRPICALADDEMDYLTPAHFLIGRASTQVPSYDLTNIKLSRLSRWQLIQQMNQQIWHRWHHEYLTSLQRANKWHKNQPNISTGQIVLIKDENLPPCKWLLGKIIELHPGKDGNVWVVTIKTTNGIIKRPIHKTCRLPAS